MAVYYLPDLASLNAFDGSGADDRGYETRILGREDFAGLYTPEWGNALSSKRPHLDMICAGAYLDGQLAGLAGASADCDAWSNVKSARCAMRAGFRTAWVQMTAKKI